MAARYSGVGYTSHFDLLHEKLPKNATYYTPTQEIQTKKCHRNRVIRRHRSHSLISIFWRFFESTKKYP